MVYYGADVVKNLVETFCESYVDMFYTGCEVKAIMSVLPIQTLNT